MKRILTHWTLAFITLAMLMWWGLKDPFIKETARLKSFDLIQQYDTTTLSEDVVIVEIDEQSIEKYGQWPWRPRPWRTTPTHSPRVETRSRNP